jgi:tetratricopeptide (TPR) repeat protein
VAREFTQAEADQHNALTSKGWALTEGRLVIHGAEPSGRPGWYSRWQLRRAIRCYEQALTINPESWSSTWALGKIYQRLGEQENAFTWFARAHAIKSDVVPARS